MLRFFRTRAPLIGLFLLVAFLITLPGIRHPLPMLALTVFTLLAWRALSRWRVGTEAERTAEESFERAAADWDARHSPPDDIDGTDDSEAWRESLGSSEDWRDSADDDEV